MTRIVLVDNYDSFTHNLAHALAAAGAEVSVHRNDAVTRADIAALRPDGIVLSPGPGHPAEPRDFGVCADLVRDPLDVPMLGVCLGMQGMAHHTGGTVLRAADVVHGEATECTLDDDPLFEGLPRTVPVGRYHSLCVDPDLPAEWNATATTADGTLMAIRHRTRAWTGLQFHPESILTPDGARMITNFLKECA